MVGCNGTIAPKSLVAQIRSRSSVREAIQQYMNVLGVYLGY